MALKSDAIESIVNIVGAIFALGAITFADKPADRDHPYGHGKIEHFSAAFEGGLISLAAAIIIFESIRTLIEGHQIQELSTGLIINLGAGLCNGILGLFLIRNGKKLKSKAMEADGHHIISDFYTTLGIGVGLLVVKFTGIVWLDPIISLITGGLLGFTGFRLVQESSAALLDTEDPVLVEKIVGIINKLKTPDIITVHELRTMRTGRHAHVDIHIVVPDFFQTTHSHDLVEDFGKKILAEGNIDGECHLHIDPCHMNFCKNCSYEPCPIRKAEFIEPLKLTSEIATAPGLN